ncbi:MAG TPA: SIS domain-containing protein [Steroidobacteraceae bacterium]
MKYLGHPQAELEAAGGIWTAREISQQPAVWPKIHSQLNSHAATLRAWLRPLLDRKDLRIVLTGAGTSAFIGETLAPALKQATRLRVEAIATTDLVGSPATWLDESAPTLLVSFARSGNSPESLAAVNLAEQLVRDRHHLIVTCNREGELYRRAQKLPNAHVLLLPEETDDRGFAMTSSFTGMVLAAALAFDALPQEEVAAIAQWGAGVLDTRVPLIEELARAGFERVVYLGGQEFKGLAREAALKMLELSDGNMVALAETPLGFRHGPKTIVNGKTLVVMFLSNDPYARQYEADLLRELRADGVAGRVVALGAAEEGISVGAPATASNLALCFPYAVFAQTFAFLRSLSLGLRPDTPNARGVVNRVVQGVSIYPWNPSR